MIYFTELARDLSGDQSKPEVMMFQFYLKELPESIKFPKVTKVNHIEYNGGFHTNQIMGVFPKEVEWEGCFYGTYEDKKGNRYSAKERATQIESFMGRPIRVGFAVPNGSDDFIPGSDQAAFSNVNSTAAGKAEDRAKDDAGNGYDGGMNGIVGVYVIEEYDIEIVNYVDVNYRIKLTPHMRQGKIKPSAAQVVEVKLNVDAVSKASAAIIRKPIKGKNGARALTAAKNGKVFGLTAKEMAPKPRSENAADSMLKAKVKRESAARSAEVESRRLGPPAAKALPPGSAGKPKGTGHN